MSTQNQYPKGTLSQSNPQEPKRTFSDLIVDYLEQFGVEFVFGVPGVHVMGLYEALTRSEKRGGPRAIITRHESGAAFMAAGYARETGKIGVCCATAGPGTTNAITGIAMAHAEHLPVLAITGQGFLPAFGMGAVQESSPHEGDFPDILNTIGMLELCTSYNTMVTHPHQLERKLAAAFTAALNPSRRGAAAISIPPGFLQMAYPLAVAFPNLANHLSMPSSFVEASALEKLWEEIESLVNGNRKAVFLVGHDCAGASEELTRLAELLNAPLITTVRGRSWINQYHPLARGVFGPLWAHLESTENFFNQNTHDLLLAFGTSMNQAGTGGWLPSLVNEKLIHIHPSDIYFRRSPWARLHVHGTVKRVCQELITRLEPKLQQAGIDLPPVDLESQEQNADFPARIAVQMPEVCHSDAVPIKPQRLMYELKQNLPPEARIVADIGNSVIWSAHYLIQSNPENYRVMFGQSSMASAPTTAIGTAFGAPGTPVVCIVGDGGMLMLGMDITVAVEEGLPVIFVILNDHGLGMVKARHNQIGEQAVNLDIPPVDFNLLAQALGAKGITIRHPDEFAELDWQAICSRRGPTILDVYIDPNESLTQGMT